MVWPLPTFWDKMLLSELNPGETSNKCVDSQVNEPSLCAGEPPDCLVGGDQGGWAIKGDKVCIMHQVQETREPIMPLVIVCYVHRDKSALPNMVGTAF